jgi:hypothetical protein
MGSQISSLPNQSIIDDKTQNTIVIMNRILNFILTQSDIKDMISLANPDTCAKWIVIAETKISDLFDKIQIKPEKGREGVIYLKKIDTLQKETKKDGLNQYYCKILAFFFIRMFQVVGALALSIIDTKLPDRDYLETSTKVEIAERKGVPFFKKLEDKPKLFGLFGGQLSGANVETINPFQQFSAYFRKNPDGTYSLNSFSREASKIKLVPGIVIMFNGNKMIITSKVGSSSVTFTLKLVESQLVLEDVKREIDGRSYITPFTEKYSYIRESSGQVYVIRDTDFANFILNISQKLLMLPKSNTINILNRFNYLTNSSESHIKKIKDSDIREENGGIFIKEEELSSGNPKFYFGFSKTVAGKTYIVNVSFNLTISENTTNKFTVEISNLENKSKGLVDFTPSIKEDNDDEESESTRNFILRDSLRVPVFGSRDQTIPQYLVKKFSELIPEAVEAMQQDDFKRKQGYLAPVKEAAGTDEFLRTTDLWRTLLQEPPIKSFCVARALQLLNKTGLMSQIPESIHPLIFNAKFALVANNSLPTPGQSITTAAPFKALQTLYQTPTGIVDKIDSTKEQSLEKLIKSFESTKVSSLKDILERSGTEVAAFESDKEKAKVVELRKQAIKLFNTHFDHVRKVNNLLKKMFILEKGPITLNPAILNKGVMGIEQIAIEARDLLTDYYSNCQADYMVGVKILTEPKKIVLSASKGNNSNNTNRTF